MERHASQDEYKKKTILIVLAIIIIAIIATVLVLFYADNKIKETSNGQSISAKKDLTAEEIANLMKEKVENIGTVVVYDETNDLNNLLGRPNQYTSKVTFEDTRLEQSNKDNEFLTEEERKEPTGGTIEVFANKSDMQKRKDYVEQISTSASIFAQYIYSKGNAILRLEHDLTPEQAKVYETAFNEIVK